MSLLFSEPFCARNHSEILTNRLVFDNPRFPLAEVYFRNSYKSLEIRKNWNNLTLATNIFYWCFNTSVSVCIVYFIISVNYSLLVIQQSKISNDINSILFSSFTWDNQIYKIIFRIQYQINLFMQLLFWHESFKRYFIIFYCCRYWLPFRTIVANIEIWRIYVFYFLILYHSFYLYF